MFSTQLFQSERLYLEAYDPEKDSAAEAAFTLNLDYAWLLDPDEIPHPLTAFEIKKKREEQLKKAGENGSAFYFAIKSRTDEQFLGVVALPWVMWNNGEGVLQILVGEVEDRQAILVEVLDMALRYVFEELHLYYVSTGTAEFQPVMLETLLAAGFKPAVRQRQMAYRDGRLWDRLIAGMSLVDWQTLHPEE